MDRQRLKYILINKTYFPNKQGIIASSIFLRFQGTIEEKIYQRQLQKQCLSGSVVDSINNDKIKFSTADLKVKKFNILVFVAVVEKEAFMSSSNKVQRDLDGRLFHG